MNLAVYHCFQGRVTSRSGYCNVTNSAEGNAKASRSFWLINMNADKYVVLEPKYINQLVHTFPDKLKKHKFFHLYGCLQCARCRAAASGD